MIEFIQNLWDLLSHMLGLNPVMTLPVFLMVSLLAKLTKVRQRFPNMKNFFLGIFCIIFASAVSYFGEYESWKQFAMNSVILGSFCALTYQIVKSLFKGVKSFIEKRFKDKTGISIEIDDDPSTD